MSDKCANCNQDTEEELQKCIACSRLYHGSCCSESVCVEGDFACCDPCAGLRRTQLDAIREALAARPESTRRNYGSKVKEFRKYCDLQKFPDGDLVHEGKLLSFLNAVIEERIAKNKGLSNSTIGLYVSAIVDLHKLQKLLGKNKHEHPRGKSVRDYLECQYRQKNERARATFVDRGLGTILEGYTTVKELVHLCNTFVKKNTPEGMRNRAMQLMSNDMSFRGESARSFEFADLGCVMLDNEGAQGGTFAIIGLLNHGKTNKFGEQEFGAALRSFNVRKCSIGAIALYLFQRFHVNNEPFPNLSDPSDWYKIKLFKNRVGSRKEPMTYNAHYDAVNGALEEAGLFCKKVTHSARGCSIRMAELGGASLDDMRTQGRWNRSALEGSYLSHLPRECMRVLAGFDPKDSKAHFIARDVEPPESLLKKIFPMLERYEMEQANAPRNERSYSTIGFIKLLKMLRKVILQDAAILKDEWTNHPLFKYRMFKDPVFIQFAAAVKTAESKASEKIFAIEVERLLPKFTKQLTTRMLSLENVVRGIAVDVNKVLQGGQIVTTTRSSVFYGNEENDANANNNNDDYQNFGDLSSDGLSQSLSTILEVYEEWHHGINGGRSVVSMEADYGAKWRKGKGDPQRFCRRKKIIEGIKKYSVTQGISEDEACTALENLRLEKKKSVDWFSKSNELTYIIEAH